MLKLCRNHADKTGAEPGIDAPGSIGSKRGVRRSA